MLSVVFKQGAVEIAEDTVAISDSFKNTPNKPAAAAGQSAANGKNRILHAGRAAKKENTDEENTVSLPEEGENAQQSEAEKETKPYVFPSLAEKESEYEQAIALKEELPEEEQSEMLQDEPLPLEAGPEELSNGEAERLKLMCEDMVQKAINQSSVILEDAHSRAQAEYQELISNGQAAIEKAKSEGYTEGIAEGTRSQVANIRACIQQLEHTVARIEGKQEEYLLQCEQDIKWLALEIAEKILCEKIQTDELSLYPLVSAAVAKQRGSTGITVEICDDAPLLLQKLRDELQKGDDNITITPVQAPKGTCRIQTPEGFIDASLYRQLENLRDYFSAQL